MRKFWMLTLAGMAGLACAVEQTWMEEPANGEWSTTAANWDAGVVWSTDTDGAVFTNSTQKTISIVEPIPLKTLSFLSGGYSLSGDGLTFSGENAAINVASGISVTSAAPFYADSAITLAKTGEGTFCLGGGRIYGGRSKRTPLY